jgi:site-specific recombinase XerC
VSEQILDIADVHVIGFEAVDGDRVAETDTPTFHILSDSEQSLVLGALQEDGRIRDWALIALSLKTGSGKPRVFDLRNAEACALNNEHLIRFGSVVGGLDIDASVAFSSPRTIQLDDSVRAVLDTYYRWKVSTDYPLDATAPFFTTLYTRKRLVPLDFQRIVRKAKAVLGVQLKPHDQRLSFAVELLTATGDLKAVRRALGLGYVDALRVYRGYVSVDGDDR